MKMFSIAAIAFAITGLAGAAEEPAVKPVAASTQAEQEALPVGSPIETSGKVTSIHSVPMVGISDPHMIVKLEDEQGAVDIVDLGATSVLKENGIEPKQGQQFWINGRVGKINDKFLIVAEQISESKLVTIERASHLREETVKHSEAQPVNTSTVAKTGTDPKAAKTETVDAGQKLRTVEGTVIHSRHVKIEGEAEEHVLAKIQTESGIAVIDLGTCPAMPNALDLTAGKMVVATGYVGQLNGKPIIMADSVGNLSGIQRTAAATIAAPKSATK